MNRLNTADKTFVENRKAYHDYEVLDTLETGIVLSGIEVKSILSGAASISGAYAVVLKGELWLIGANITGQSLGMLSSYKPNRDRKLLCHKKELDDLKLKSEAKCMTLVPLKIYMKNGKLKLLVGVARGKKLVDKRNDLKNKDISKQIAAHI